MAVILSPREFYQSGIGQGGQAPSLIFAMSVVVIEESIRLALSPHALPVLGNQWLLSAVLWLGVVTFIATPTLLHLIAGLQTALLVPFVRTRAPMSETVQVLGYATAPCVLVGIPIAELRVGSVVWGGMVLAQGIAVRHDIGLQRALLLTALPAALIFGYGFRGFAAIGDLLTQWYII